MAQSRFRRKRPARVYRTANPVDIPITDQSLVRSPKSGKWIKIATAVRQGFMNEIVRDGFKGWEWADNAFPPETQHEKFARLESQRILKFVNDNSDLPPPWKLGATIETDNGRLRLWFEISEHTSSDEDNRRLDQLKKWKQRLVRFDKKRDPQPHFIQEILKGVEEASKESDRNKYAIVSKDINSWIVQRLYDWEKGNGRTRTMIDAELFGVLRLCRFADDKIENILNKCQVRIRTGAHPFAEGRSDDGRSISREQVSVTPRVIKSRIRTWKKRQLPL